MKISTSAERDFVDDDGNPTILEDALPSDYDEGLPETTEAEDFPEYGLFVTKEIDGAGRWTKAHYVLHEDENHKVRTVVSRIDED